MPRTCLIVALTAVVVLAAACGDGEGSGPVDREAGSRSEAGPEDLPEPDTTSEEALRDAVGSGTPGTGAPEPTSQDSERADSTTVAESEREPEQDEQSTVTTTVAAELVQVQLGDRFEWCADVEAAWDGLDESVTAVRAAEAILRDAEDTYGSATDELDRAEAFPEVERARSIYRKAVDAADDSRSRATNGLARSYEMHNEGREDALGVASSRAWLAFVDNADSRTLAAISDYEDAVVALEVVGSEADAELQRAEAAYDESLRNAEVARDAVIEVGTEGLSDSLPIELEAVFNAEHYASVEALGPPPPEPGNENTNGATEAWQASLRRLQDAIDGIDGGYERYEDVMSYLIPMVPAPEDVTSTAEDWGVSEDWLESLIEWGESLSRLADARAVPVSAAYEKYADARSAEIDELMDRLFVEALAAREADYQSAVDEAASALSDVRAAHRETKSALRDTVVAARSAFDAVLAAPVSGDDSYQAFRKSFQESCM